MPTRAKTQKLTLDVSGFYPFSLVEREDGWAIDVDLKNASQRSRFIQHMHGMLKLRAGDGTVISPEGTLESAQFDKHLLFPLPSAALSTLTFEMNGQPVSQMSVADRMLVPTQQHATYQLGISETRALGMTLRDTALNTIPYDRIRRQEFDPEVHTPITDLHTHYSAQIKSQDLLKLAFDADVAAKKNDSERICYPIELLKLLKVEPDPSRVEEQNQTPVDMVGRAFNPMREEGLDCETEGKKCKGIPISELSDRQREAIIRQMHIAPDDTIAFSDMDRKMYRYRNPFVKHPALAKDIIKKIAEDYADMGVEYAELSTGSMFNPEWFRQMTEAVNELDRDGVGPDHKKMKLRFLVGLPRNATPQETMVSLERVKYLARHPYIVGVDLLGYESNKTSDFHWALAHLARWASASEKTDLKPEDGWDFKRDFILRVHAGETTKNLTNVGDAIHIADDYGVRVRLGHAMHWKGDERMSHRIRNLVQDDGSDLLASERCMDANQVYRTKKLVKHQPAMLHAKSFNGRELDEVTVPGFLGSDGGGALGIHPTGLAYSALEAGWSLDDLAHTREWEKGYIARQEKREEAKKAAFEKHYGMGVKGLDHFLEGYDERMAKIPQRSRLKDYLSEPFHNKTPFLIGGASGSSWELMDKMDQQTVVRAAEFLVRTLDPDKTYFVLGRVQKEGVSRAIDKAVLDYNLKHPEHQFAVLGRYNGADKQPSGELAESLTWVQDIPGERDAISSSMIDFSAKHGGKGIIFNGSDFSAEMVGLAEDRGVPHAIQVPKSGLFVEVAATAATESHFSDIDQFVDRLFERYGEGHLFASKEERDHLLRQDVDVKKVLEEVKVMKLENPFDKNWKLIYGRGEGRGGR